MSDNAGFSDNADTPVHPLSTGPSPQKDNIDTNNGEQLTETNTVEVDGDVDVQDHTGMLDFEMEEGFDPATLANLAALSRIGEEGDEDGHEDLVDSAEGFAALLPADEEEVVKDIQDVLETRPAGEEQEQPQAGGSQPPPPEPPAEKSAVETEGEQQRQQEEEQLRQDESDERNESINRLLDRQNSESHHSEQEEERDYTRQSSREDYEDEDDERRSGEDEDGDFMDSRYVYENGRLKRKRHRSTLSCTECHRRCDRNIPCSRCIKRGVPSMCRMEAPVLPERKKRKAVKDVPVNYELGVRVQALESLIRSGSSLDPDSAQSAAMETILHATRAAESGSLDASTALAQLTESAISGTGIGGMSQDAQSSLLMDVLQQLSVASVGKPTEGDPQPRASSSKEVWSRLPTARLDAISRITASYESDDSANKMNLTSPGFREDNGRVFIPPTVRYIEKQMRNENFLGMDALPVWGDSKLLEEGVKFAYGPDHVGFKRKNIAAIHTNSLIGSLRLAGIFLSRFPSPPGRQVYLPSPTSEEDTAALRDAGLEIRHFRFVDKKTGSVDFDGLREDLLAAPAKSAVLLYVSGTMPTGTELTAAQWRLLTTILNERSLIPLVVMAFQGLASGDTAKDAQPLRLMAHEGLPVVLCQTFDAMMGLYSDSPSVVSIVTQSEDTRDRVNSQLRAVARSLHVHPSPWGAYAARAILSDPKLHPAWLAEIKAMSDRLRSVRDKLYDLLANKFKTPGSWIHLKKSTGMYCTTLLASPVNDALVSKRHVYLLPSGCFSLGCLNAAKIESLARSIDYCVLAHIRETEEAQAQQIAMELALAAAREAAAREEAEAAAEAAREEDQMLMERSIQSAIEAQRRAEEDERRREEEERGLEDAVRKAAERAETARQAEAILATITAASGY